MEKLIDINKLSELLSMKKSTIYGWIHEGCVPYYKLVGGVRFKEKEIEEWLSKRHRKGRTKRSPEVMLE